MTRALMALFLVGCGWNNLPNQDYTALDQPLWDPAGAIPTVDGLAVPLTLAGGLVFVRPNAEPRRVDLGEGRISKLSAAPDQRTVVAFVQRYFCDEKNPKMLKKVKRIEECNAEVLRTETDIDLIQNAEVVSTIGVVGEFNALRFSDDGKFAVAYLDLNDPDLVVSGVVDLTSVAVIDLAAGTTDIVTVRFAADQVLFTYDTAGDAQRAVVLSKSSAAVIDLTAEVPVVDVSFSLSLDPDVVVTPVGVALTPNGQYALIPVQGSTDLYILDLDNKSVNIVELSAIPTDIAVNRVEDHSVLVYRNLAQVDVLDHEFFDTISWPLDEAMNRIVSGSSFAMLYSNVGSKDIYKLGLDGSGLVEFRMENPPIALQVAPGEDFAIALTRAESGYSGDLIDRSPGFEVLDLTDDKGRSRPFLLQGAPLGLAWSASDTSLDALILQEGVDTLYSLDLYTGDPLEIELSSPPQAIGTMPDGSFYITHADALGKISFFDPNAEPDKAITEVVGFAALGWMDPTDITTEEAPK